MEQTKANTEVSEFKIIDDEKNTPTLKEAQDFVGGMVECITWPCLLYTSPSPRDLSTSRMPSSA